MTENDNLPDSVTMDEFQEIALKEFKIKNNEEEFAFVPQMTGFPEIEFYFMGQNLYSVHEGKSVFSVDGVNKQFQRYHFFNQTIADDTQIHRYMRKSEKVDSNFYIHNGIQRYDFRYFSEAKLYRKKNIRFIL